MVDAASLPPRPLVVSEVDELAADPEDASVRDCLPAFVLAHDPEAVVALVTLAPETTAALVYSPDEERWAVAGRGATDGTTLGIPDAVSTALSESVSSLYDAAHVRPWTLDAEALWDGVVGSLPARPLSDADTERVREEWFVTVLQPLAHVPVDGARRAVLLTLNLHNPSAGADVAGLAGFDPGEGAWTTLDRRSVSDGNGDASPETEPSETPSALVEWLLERYDPSRLAFVVGDASD